MPVTVITKNSSSAGAVPSAGQLVRGELAVNVTDRKLYTLDSTNTVVLLSSGPVGLTTTGTSGAATLVNNVINIPIYGDGTVKSLAVASANGFAGTVASSTTNPIITLSTTVNGILKGNGTSISNASPTTDYQIPITLTTLNTSGASTFVSGTLNIPQYQGVVSLTTTGTTGAATFSANTLNIPQYQGAITFTTTGNTGAATFSANALNIPQYQGAISLSTTGTSGAATFSANVLNIPNYTVAVAATPTAIGLVFGNTGATNTGIGNAISIGAGVTSSVAVGTSSTISASIASVTAVGASTSVTGSSGTAIGSAATSVTLGTAVGATATVQTSGGVAIGNSADVLTSSANSIAIGNGSSVASATSVAIGVNAIVNTTSTNSIVIGPNASTQAGSSSSIAIGNQATSGTTAIAIGNTTTALGSNAIAIGNGVTSAATDAIAIGRGLSPSGLRTILIGSSITDSSAANGVIAINSTASTLTVPNTGLFISGMRAANGSSINGLGSLQTFQSGTGNTKEIFSSQDSFTAYGINWQKQPDPVLVTGAAGTVDVTANQLQQSIIIVNGSTATVTLRMPTAADVNLQFPLIASAGLTNIAFDVSFINASSSYTVLIGSNTGMSASFGLTTIATSQSAVFRFRRTGSTTWTYNRISS